MFSNLAGIEVFFLVCATVGASFVFLRLVMQFLGGGGDVNADAPVDVDASAADVEAHHADSDVGFKFLSLHGLTSFFMMFGLVGFAMHRQSGAGALLSVLAALGAGFASVWIIGKLFRAVGRLQSSGTISTTSAVGCLGTVYLTIPPEGAGKVMIDVQNRLREFSAVAHAHEELKTGVPVKVVGVSGGVLIVEKIA